MKREFSVRRPTGQQSFQGNPVTAKRDPDGMPAGSRFVTSSKESVSASRVEMPAGTQSIARTLAVMEFCARSDDEVGISDISRAFAFAPATTHRIVRALLAAGYLMQNPDTEKYSLGKAALVLGVRASNQLGMSSALALLVQLRDSSDETVNLGARDGDEMEVLLQAESRQPLRMSQPPGHRLPVYASAMGKVCLAFSPEGIEHEVEAIAHALQPLTSSTITSPALLKRELELVSDRGYAIDDGEAREGARCVGVPVLSPQGTLLCAIAVQAPVVRMSFERCEELALGLKRIAVEVAAVLPAGRSLAR